MMKKIAALLLTLTACACADPVKQPVPILPAFPAAPVDTAKPIGPPMLPWIECLTQQGPSSSQCRSLEPSPSAGSTTVSAPRR